MAKIPTIAPATIAMAGGQVAGEADAQHETVEGLVMVGQEQSNWCWAAVIQSLLELKGESLSQQKIVSDHLYRTGRTYDCAPPNSTRQEGGLCTDGSCTASCNDEHSIKVALAEYGLFHDLLSEFGAPAFEDIQREIHERRPVPSHVTWSSGDGHIILVCGWSLDQGTGYIHVLDPQSTAPGQAVTERRMTHATYAWSYTQQGKIGAVDYSYKLL